MPLEGRVSTTTGAQAGRGETRVIPRCGFAGVARLDSSTKVPTATVSGPFGFSVLTNLSAERQGDFRASRARHIYLFWIRQRRCGVGVRSANCGYSVPAFVCVGVKE